MIATSQGVPVVENRRAFSARLAPETLLVVPLTLGALALRICFLDSKSLWIDETFTAQMVQLPFGALIHVLTHAEMNMFLFHLLLHEWVVAAGASEFMLRLPSAIFDTATVPLVYALGTALGNRRAGLIAALMMTVNATSIHSAQDARSYSMFIALTTLASIYFIRCLKRATTADYLGYVGCGGLAVYAHMFAILALPAQWLFLFVAPASRVVRIRLTTCMVAIGVVSFCEFFFAFTGYHGNLRWIAPFSLAALENFFFVLAGAYQGEQISLTEILGALYVIGVVSAILWTPKAGRPAVLYLLLSICIPLGFAIAVSLLVKPTFVARYLLPALPLVALLAAFGFERLAQPFSIAVVIAVTTLSFAEVLRYYRLPPTQDWRGVVAFIETNARPGDELILERRYRSAVEYYMSRSRQPQVLPKTIELASDKKLMRTLRELMVPGSHRRVWLTCPDCANESMLEMLLPGQVVPTPDFSGVQLFLLKSAPS